MRTGSKAESFRRKGAVRKERLHVLLAQAEREEAKRKQALETDLLHAQEQMRELNEEVHYYEQQVKQLFMAAGAKPRTLL